MERFGRSGEGHAGRNHAGHQAMLGNGAEHAVSQHLLLLVRQVAGDQQPEVAGEIDPADDIVAQVHSPDGDAGGIGGTDRSDGVVLFADTHRALHFPNIEVDFAIRRI
jgi:hypothetical protein